ncbi:MAG: GNAT family N-acetyltransferase [Candidatus Bathyarchaeota archaeon]|nr:MAG: GNAT family N-acetyltransferase [Candidatus Bathyarchaeota archaeon]
MLGNVSLEQATVEDAGQLAEISKRAFHSDIHVMAPSKGADASAREGGGPIGYDSPEFQTRMMRVCRYYKMIYDEQIVGGLIASRRRHGHYELERIFVDPKYHNRGIGTEAMKGVFTLFPDAKIWTLGTPEWNVRTKHFYEKLGFVQIGWTKDEPAWNGRYYQKSMDPHQRYKTMKISELTSGMRGVEVEAKILEISEPRHVRSRTTDEPLRVANAIITDETGTIKLALWNEQIKQVKISDRIRINSGYITSFRGEKQLNAGKYGPLIILL